MHSFCVSLLINNVLIIMFLVWLERVVSGIDCV